MGFGSTIALWLLTWKLVTGTDVVQQHGLLLVFAAVLILVGSNWWRLDFSGSWKCGSTSIHPLRRPYACRRYVICRPPEDSP
jgi:hypothetical protein